MEYNVVSYKLDEEVDEDLELYYITGYDANGVEVGTWDFNFTEERDEFINNELDHASQRLNTAASVAQWVLSDDLLFLEYQGEQFGYYDPTEAANGYYWCRYNPNNDYVEVEAEGYAETAEQARANVSGGATVANKTASSKKESTIKMSAKWEEGADGDLVGLFGGFEAHVVYQPEIDKWGVLIFHNSGRIQELPGSYETKEEAISVAEAELTDSFLWQSSKNATFKLTQKEANAILARRKKAEIGPLSIVPTTPDYEAGQSAAWDVFQSEGQPNWDMIGRASSEFQLGFKAEWEEINLIPGNPGSRPSWL